MIRKLSPREYPVYFQFAKKALLQDWIVFYCIHLGKLHLKNWVYFVHYLNIINTILKYNLSLL